MTGNAFSDETGARYGRLVVLAKANLVGGGARWHCVCDCGVETVVRGQGLRAGGSRSCGKCVKRGPASLELDESSFRVVYNGYKHRAKRKNLEFSVDRSEFRALTTMSCHYCGAKASNEAVRKRAGTSVAAYAYNGVDRVDSSLGYTKGNMVPCCKTCNIAKSDMPQGEFLAWIERLTNHRKTLQ